MYDNREGYIPRLMSRKCIHMVWIMSRKCTSLLVHPYHCIVHKNFFEGNEEFNFNVSLNNQPNSSLTFYLF
jgi:hypothetical protein